MEEHHQPVGGASARPDDQHVQVDGDGHRPEERAGVGERGEGSLDDTVHRVAAENSPDPEGVGGGGEPVGHGEEEQQPPRGGAQVREQRVAEDDEGRAEEGQRAGAQHHHLLGQVNHRVVVALHRDESARAARRCVRTARHCVRETHERRRLGLRAFREERKLQYNPPPAPPKHTHTDPDTPLPPLLTPPKYLFYDKYDTKYDYQSFSTEN